MGRFFHYLRSQRSYLLLLFMEFALCFQRVSQQKECQAAITGGLLIIMYALKIFAGFQESLDKLKYVSFFHYYDPNAALVGNHIDTLSIAVFLAVGIITVIIGAVVFVKRDIVTTLDSNKLASLLSFSFFFATISQ